jgi:repressor LexA
MLERALSIQQQLICCAMSTYTQTHRFPPTVREIGAWVGFGGMRSLQLALASLEQQGYLKRHQHTRRSLVLTDQGLAVAARWQFIMLEAA